jgi:SAM-dependent methyltransferase
MYTKLGYEIFRCGYCSLAQTKFTEPMEEFIKRFYSKGYYTGDPRFGAFFHYEEDRACINRNTAQSLSRLKKIKPSGRLLDVGCAMGFFVEQAQKTGYDAYGFDPSAYAVKKARNKLQDRVKEGTIASVFYPKESFDIITMFDVFEHLGDPVADIKKLKAYLKPDGVLLIATGNTRSLAAKILGKNWTFYSPPQHLFYFTPDNLVTALGRAGFEPRRWFSVDKWLSLGYILHLAHTSADYPMAEAVEGLVKKIDSLRKLPVWVPMRDNMVVIAGKREI